jgi:acetylornithine/N-succinyldiaminopimelate aminotransferase
MFQAGARYDVVADHAKDMYVYDVDGTEYLDFYAGIAVNSAGNCNEKVVAAIKEQAEKLIHASNYPYSIPQAKLAKLICETIGMDKIFFQNSGSEANELMIKMVRKYGVEHYGPEHYHIVTAKHSFHGRTYGALSATGQPENGCQIGYHPILPGFSYADFNDLESFQAACTENTIAIMVEPVQGEGGVYPATEEFLTGLRKFCDEKNIFLILDEVQTGWGRCGDIMAYMSYGIKPDAVTMAKAMGGGMPISACCATAELASAIIPGAHGSTYGGNPVCCAAAYASITEILGRKLPEQAKKMGAYFMKKLEALPNVKEVRGRGLLVGVEFKTPIAMTVKHDCLDHRLLITAVSDSTIRIVPPLILTESDCDRAVAILHTVIKDIMG